MHAGWEGLDDGDLRAGSEMLPLKHIYFPAQINGCWYQGATWSNFKPEAFKAKRFDQWILKKRQLRTELGDQASKNQSGRIRRTSWTIKLQALAFISSVE